MQQQQQGKGLIASVGRSILAFLALVCIQVSIGILYKFAGASGKYNFSAASSLTISEFVKLLLSYFLLVATIDPTAPSVVKLSLPSRHKSTEKLYDELSNEEPLGVTSSQSLEFGGRAVQKLTLSLRWYTANAILWNSAVPSAFLPIAGLAALYAFNNHFGFWLFLMIDPGTIALVKSASTFISAYILWTIFGRTTNRLQWLAIILQGIGIVTSQYNPCTGGTVHPIGSYALLFISVSITAMTGCINDHITKTMKIPLHAINVYLYSCGFVMNLLAYNFTRASNPTSVGFFEGYDSIAIMVVFFNCIIGLVITAVYKYADAVIKTMAQTISTGILLVLSAFLFSSPLGVLQGCGVAIIFISVYQYFVCSSGPLLDAIHVFYGLEVGKKSDSFNSKRLVLGGLVGMFAFGGLIKVYSSDKGLPREANLDPIAPSPAVLPVQHDHFLSPEPHLGLNSTILDFFKDVLVVVNWDHAHYEPNFWHWREIYPKELFPNVVHYGPNDPILQELLPGVDDDFKVEDKTHPQHPASFGYNTLLRALAEEAAGSLKYRGVLWTNYEVLFRVDRLAGFSKENVWYTPNLGFMPLNAQGTDEADRISEGWLTWFDSGMGWAAINETFNKLPEEELDAFFQRRDVNAADAFFPFPVSLPWSVPFAIEERGHRKLVPGGSSDSIFIPLKYTEKAVQLLTAAKESNLYIDFALPLLSEWLQTFGAGLSGWTETQSMAIPEITYESVVEADKIGQTCDVYNRIVFSSEKKASKWKSYIQNLYSI
ncbi:hypothetical protein HDU97_006908 [Phlyctochytrium planicorne]|nr:hypothetical protein HDU97_006908 [Phlyctochytrium planicorne]